MGLLTELMEVIPYVQDMQAQMSFYRDKMGLVIEEPRGLEDYSWEYWVEFDTGSCTLALHGGQRRLGEDAPKIVFRVADIEATRSELLDRGVQIGELRSPDCSSSGPGLSLVSRFGLLRAGRWLISRTEMLV